MNWLSRVATASWLAAAALTLGCKPGASLGPTGGPTVDGGPTIRTPMQSKGGGQTANGCNGVTENGECQDGVAVTCNVKSGGMGSLLRTDCKALGKSCVVETERGAECQVLQTGGGGGGGGAMGGACGNGLTQGGFCANNTALWCDVAKAETHTSDCGALGMTCETDQCGAGAWCCNPQPDICAGLGFAGKCDGNTATWCYGADGMQLAVKPCGDTKTCQVNVCGDGAYCCPAAAADHFDDGLDGWSAFGAPGYTLAVSDGTALISGDDFAEPYNHSGGMQKVVTIDPSAFTLSFRWRSTSTNDATPTSNANLDIRDGTGNTLLYTEALFSGGGDSGWQTYTKNLSSSVAGNTTVMILLYLNDAWDADYGQTNAYDDISVGAAAQ